MENVDEHNYNTNEQEGTITIVDINSLIHFTHICINVLLQNYNVKVNVMKHTKSIIHGSLF